jgi:hypothetical protein
MRRVRRLVIAACCGLLAVEAGAVTTARSSTTTPPAVDLGALGLPVEQTVASVAAGLQNPKVVTESPLPA